MIKKDAMAEKLEAVAKEHSNIVWMDLYGIIKELRRKEPAKIVQISAAGDPPDEKYFQYFLKTHWDMRYSEGLRPGTNWTAGRCYEFDDGWVEIWTHDYVYAYNSMADTHDWDLD